MKNPSWHPDEILLALDLYFRLKSGEISKSNPKIIELSELLKRLPIHPKEVRNEKFRNPNGVGLKLSNFLSLDPSYSGSGMQSSSVLDRQLFDRYYDDRARLHELAAAIRRSVSDESAITILEQPDRDDVYEEGRILTRLHRYRERNRQVVEKKKRKVFRSTGRLACEVCDFDFTERYGDLGAGFIECHHKVPLAEAGAGKTRLRDLALVCANCHRMLHRDPHYSVDELRELVNRAVE